MKTYDPFFTQNGGNNQIYKSIFITEENDQIASVEDKLLLDNYLKKTGLIYDKSITLRLNLLMEGKRVLLYHGSTANFKQFNQKYAKSELNKQFYGDGIFFTPSKDIAYKYANANRNYGIPEGVIDELKSLDKRAGELLEDIVKLGFDKGWNTKRSQDLLDDVRSDRYRFKIDLDVNDINDIYEYVIGAKDQSVDTLGSVFSSLSGETNSLPYDVIDILKKIGIKQNLPIPKIYTVSYEPTKVKVSTKQVKSGKYDTVIYIGKDLVDNVPEVQTFQNNVPVFRVEEI